MVISPNPQIKSSENGKEKILEIYFVALKAVTTPPGAMINCFLGKKKFVKLNLKLPIMMNRFVLLEEINDLDEFAEIFEKGEQIGEQNIKNVNPKKICNFEDLCNFFEYNVIVGEERIAGHLRIINLKQSLISFEVEYQEMENRINLKFKFRAEENLNNDDERVFFSNLARILGETFEKIFGNSLDDE